MVTNRETENHYVAPNDGDDTNMAYTAPSKQTQHMRVCAKIVIQSKMGSLNKQLPETTNT